MSFRRYREYRQTGIDWLGAVPAHWKVDRLKWSARDCRNGIWGDDPKGGKDDVICVRVADFDRTQLTARLDQPTLRCVPEKERASRLLRPGDLLIEKSGGGELQPVGCVVLFEDSRSAVCSNFVARVRIAEGHEPSYWRYLHAAAYSARLNTKSIKQNTGIQNLDSQQYFDELAPFPPPEEQVAIATFLNRETAKIDALVTEKERLVALIHEKRQALISQAVTRGIKNDPVLKNSGNDWLGLIPQEWELRRISNLCTKLTNGFVGPTRDIFVEQGTRYLQSLHIKNNRIVFDVPYFVSREWSNRHSKSILRVGDVLVVQTGDIGQTAVVTPEFEGCNCHALIVISPLRSAIEGDWLSWVLNSEYGKQTLLSIQTGALHPHLNCGDVKDVLIPVPPPSEQRAIVIWLTKELDGLEALLAQAHRSIKLLQERRAILISAAVTGQIDVRPDSMRSAA